VIYTKKAGRNHWYVNDAGEKVPQVSAIAKSGVDKSNQMIAWAARITADYVLDHWEELAALSPSERYWTVRGVAQKARNEAATKGTKFHALIDRLASGERVEYDASEYPVSDVQAGLAFLSDFDAQPVLSEARIWSEQWNYAGRFDTIQSLATGPVLDGVVTYQNWLLDYKRANGVYAENALQDAGYDGADWVITDDGRMVALPQIDRLGIVHINDELPGGYALIPVHRGVFVNGRWEDLFTYFRHAQHMAHFAEIGDQFLGDPVSPPEWADDEEEMA